MSKKQFDTLIVGPVSLDHNIDFEGREYSEVGGAIVQSGFAASRTGHSTALFTKLNPRDADINSAFESSGADLFWKASTQTTSIQNIYFTADKEAAEFGGVPTRTSVFNDSELLVKYPYFETILVSTENSVVRPRLVEWTDIETAYGTELSSAISETKSIDQALADARAAIEAIMK